MKRTPFNHKPKPMRRVSAKKAARRASPAGRADAAYLDAVRALPCCACGKPGPSDPHHCRDRPDFDEQHLYERQAAGGRTSADRDAIPLCGFDGCHRMFHLERAQFHALHGKDYYFIEQTRRAVEGA